MARRGPTSRLLLSRRPATAVATVVLFVFSGVAAVVGAAPGPAASAPEASIASTSDASGPMSGTATVPVGSGASLGSVPGSLHPGTLEVYEVAPGGATTEDPAVAYDTVSGEPILNVFEPLITYNGSANDSYVPVLATCVPGTPQCATDYGSTLVDDQHGAPYTGSAGQQPIFWTFVLDPRAEFYDPTTGNHWGVYPSDVMFSAAREMAWSTLIGVGSTPGWQIAQTLLPNGTLNAHGRAWDDGLHAPYNTTPGNILSSMLINDSAFCPAAALTGAHGCITFRADGQGSDWPFFLQLIDDEFAGAVLPCGWYTAGAQGAGIPDWTGSHAASGDGPCAVPQLGASQSTSAPAWADYLANLTSPSNSNPSTNSTSWDQYENLILGYPAPDPHVQWRMAGSGPYYATLDPSGTPPGYALNANPYYAQPSGCSGAGGLSTYAGGCYPVVHVAIPQVDVVYEPSDTVGINAYRAGQADFATISAPETLTMVDLADEGKINYYVAPGSAQSFLALNLNWSSAVYARDSFPGAPNIPHNFFSEEAARALMAESYPYAQSEATDWTVHGVPYLSATGGPIPRADGGFYP